MRCLGLPTDWRFETDQPHALLYARLMTTWRHVAIDPKRNLGSFGWMQKGLRYHRVNAATVHVTVPPCRTRKVFPGVSFLQGCSILSRPIDSLASAYLTKFDTNWLLSACWPWVTIESNSPPQLATVQKKLKSDACDGTVNLG